MKDIIIYDKSTGEVLEGYTVQSPEQKRANERYWRDHYAKMEGRKHDFTSSNMEHIHEVYEILTTAQCGYLMLLQCFIEYDTHIIVNPDKSPMITSDMMDVLKLYDKPSTFYDFLGVCLEYAIIVQIDDVYVMNDRYHFKGAIKGTKSIKTYTTKVKEVYSEVKVSDLGLIYRMLPLVHMSTNALCVNPFEKDPKRVIWMNRKELAEHLGIDANYLGRRLPKMKFGEEYVVARIKVGSEPERYTMNPNVFYRQDGKPDDTLVAMFNKRNKRSRRKSK